MSESIFKSKPEQLTPVYNDCFVVVESENSENDGFLYRYTIEVDGGEVVKGKVRPMPNGDGKVNLSRILQSFVTYKELFPVGAFDEIEKGSYVKAKVIIGEEYNGSAWGWTAYGNAPATASWWVNGTDPSYNPNSLTRTIIYNDTLTAPDFQIGDLITIEQDTVVRTQLEGIHKVLDIVEVDDTILGNYIGYAVILELPWIGWGTQSEGLAQGATFEKVVNDNIESYEFSIWNGALPFKSFINYDVTKWDGQTGFWKFMTSAPRNGYPIREDSAVFLQFGNMHNNQLRLEIKNGADIGRTNVQDATEDVKMVDVSFNRDTLPIVINNYPLDGDTKTYTAQIVGNLTVSEAFKFIVNRKCYEFEDVEICFLDRLGSIMPFQFNLKNNKRTRVERVEYTKDVETNEIYSYSLLDGGKMPVELNEKVQYTLRTDAISNEMGEYLKELISSPFTVVRFGNGEYQRCNVITNNLNIRSRFDDGLNFYEIDIEISNNDKINW